MAVHRVYFKAKNWEVNRNCPSSIVERCYISGLFGQLEEVFVIGDWSDTISEIISKPMMLEQNSIYHFCFWLKVEEHNDENEICQLQVMFDGKNDQVNRYRLSQDYIVPLKETQGWRLYNISFETQKNSITQLKFIAKKCIMTIMAAGDLEEYKNLESSTRASKTSISSGQDIHRKKRNPLDFGPFTSDGGSLRKVHNEQKLRKQEIQATELYQQILKKLDEGCIRQQIVDDIMEELTEQIRESIDLESIVKEYSSTIDTKQLQEEIRKVIKEHIQRGI